MKFLIIFFISFPCLAQVYISPQLGFSYASSDEEAYSGMTGVNLGVAGGLRFSHTAFEFGIKRSSLSNSGIGSENFSSKITDDSYYFGPRIFLGDLLSFTLGFISHNLSYEIEKEGVGRGDLEEDGSYFSYYAGAGVNTKWQNVGEFFWEGIIYPISEVKLFQVDYLVGVRIYL